MKGMQWFIGLAMVTGLVVSSEASRAGKGQSSIRVLYTSDVIGNLEPCG